MGSLGTGEIIVIVLVVLLVFGPERLPEITRKAGQLLARAREMSKSVTDSFDDEYKDVIAPIKDLKSEYDSTMSELKGAAASVGDLSVDIPKIEINPAKLGSGSTTPTDGSSSKAADAEPVGGEPPGDGDEEPSPDEETP